MRIVLTVTDGPNAGTAFAFAGRDFFLVGRGPAAHFRPDAADRYLSRFHFLVEVNPPRCRLTDLGSRNGTAVNGTKTPAAELRDGDAIRVGRTALAVRIEADPDPRTGDWSPPPAATAVATPGPPAVHADPAPAIPGYRLVRELGRGGMGVVYLAAREADGAEVALKTITPGSDASRRAVDLFLREAEVLRRLSHPNVVAFGDMGEADGVLYFTMEYVPGTDAQRVLRDRGPWSVRSAARTAVEVLGALDYAHREGFVHRDVKPANVLLRRGGAGVAVKLADFGLARVYQASRLSGLSREGEFGGTPAYMPPEQVTDYRNAAPAADQFAAAATLYHLLTGKYIHDFDADPRLRVVVVLEGEAVPLLSRRPDLPAGLAAAVHRALARDPGRRFPGCAAFAAALRPFAG